MRSIHAWAAVLLLCTSIGCETLIPAHKKSFQTEGEEIAINILPAEKPVSTGNEGQKGALPVFAAMAIPLVAEYAVKKVVAALDDETKKYTAVYSGIKPESTFYKNTDSIPELNIGGIEIQRTITKDGSRSTASVLRFLLSKNELGTNGMLQLMGDTAKLDYEKAKVAASNWYLPWPWLKTDLGPLEPLPQLVPDAAWIIFALEI